VNDLAEPDTLHRDRQSGKNGLEVDEAVTANSGNHKPEAKGCQVELVLKRSVDSDEYIEVLLGEGQQRTIFPALPSYLRNGLNRVAGKRRLKARREAFV
jgi:hypothetical protein